MRTAVLAALLAVPVAVLAQDARLVELSRLLVPMRANQEFGLPARGASPTFTVIKHTLRDLIEERLSRMDRDSVYSLQDQVNGELAVQKLVCDYGNFTCPELTERGYLKPIRVQVEYDYVLVSTGVGIDNCGFDESAYAYEFADKRWRRFWESEQTDYTEDGFQPQRLEGIEIHAGGIPQPEYLILTMGVNPWCSSNLQGLYFRVWQVKPDAAPKLLLDEHDVGMLGYIPPVHGRVGDADGSSDPGDDVLVEYTKNGMRPFAGSVQEVVRHYRLTDGKLRRIDPVALGPADFVDLWSEMGARDRANWTDPAVRSKLLNPAFRVEELDEPPDPTLHCETRPEMWQVNRGKQYFLVRWRPPFHFLMLDASKRSFPGCTEKDPEAEQFRSLFH